MKFSFYKSLAACFLSLALPAALALASGKMEVEPGKLVTINAQLAAPGANYKWIVKKGADIVTTQTTPSFSYTFVDQGEYEVNLVATRGELIENTTVTVRAGERFSTPGLEAGVLPPLSVVLSTLPAASADGRVHLLGADGRVVFDLSGSTGTILEYRVDRNVFADSDGNGVANDDTDNAGTDSYLLGGTWSSDYRAGEAPKIVAEVTLVDRAGEKAKKQAEIVFDTPPAPVADAPLVAVLDLTPTPAARDQKVHLTGPKALVAFYAKRSQGALLEYRIDRDIFTDSNGDGDPGNDIDNLNHTSFKTGDVWEAEYAYTDRQIIAQLIVVGQGGKGSRLQRGIVFDAAEKPAASLGTASAGIVLTSDKDFVLRGDPVTFAVQGLQQSPDQYTFAWDFNGDGETDKEVEGDNKAEQIYDTANLYTVSVTITDKKGNSAQRTLEILCKDVAPTAADFSFVQEGNTFRFTDASAAASNLANPALDYQWSFGDTDEENFAAQRDQTGLQNPAYTYKNPGTYLVTLSVTDADGVVATRTTEVAAGGEGAVSEAPASAKTPAEAVPTELAGGRSIISFLIKAFLALIASVIGLAALGFVGALTFLKIKNPALTLHELIEELKHKLSGLLGLHEVEEHPSIPAPPTTPAPAAPSKPAPATPTEPLEGEVQPPTKPASPVSKPVAAPGTELNKTEGPVPEWLKTK